MTTVKFTANYAYTNPNFVLQNIEEPRQYANSSYRPVLAVLKNILQRGAIARLSGKHTGTPTRLSRHLELEENIGEISQRADFKSPLYLLSDKAPFWYATIKGDARSGYYPAREFFTTLPGLLGDYGFVQQLICPEVAIEDIAPDNGREFVHQQVDFYCPLAKLVIEIDGYHHNGVVKVKDDLRDEFLLLSGIKTIRIRTEDWREKTHLSRRVLLQ